MVSISEAFHDDVRADVPLDPIWKTGRRGHHGMSRRKEEGYGTGHWSTSKVAKVFIDVYSYWC